MKKFAILIALIVAALGVSTASAQTTVQPDPTTTRTITVTEAQANQALDRIDARVARIENPQVDLQPGQVVISATVIPNDANYDAFTGRFTLVPSVNYGLLTWSVTAVDYNGNPLPPYIINQINNAIANSWVRYVRTVYGPHRVVSLTITDMDMTYVVGPRQNPRPPRPIMPPVAPPVSVQGA